MEPTSVFDFGSAEFTDILERFFNGESRSRLRQILRGVTSAARRMTRSISAHIDAGETGIGQAQRQLESLIALELHSVFANTFNREAAILARHIATAIHTHQFPTESGLSPCPAQTAMAISDDRGRLSVIIRRDGIVRCAPWIMRDEASRMFWRAVEDMAAKEAPEAPPAPVLPN